MSTKEHGVGLLEQLVRDYRNADELLRECRMRLFPYGCIARHGSADVLIVDDSECPPNQVACKFENGNVWWKPITDVTRIAYGECRTRRIRGFYLSHKRAENKYRALRLGQVKS
jgi:hypothetical protein